MIKKTNVNLHEVFSSIIIKILLTILVFIIMFPFIWMITTSFKLDGDILTRKLVLFPDHWTIKHYLNVFRFGNIGKYFINTCIVAFSTVLLSLSVVIPAAYALVILRVKGGLLISRFILFLQMIPSILLIIPLYMTMQKFHLLDNYLSLIISGTTFTIPFCFLLASSYYSTLPIELFESAYIDGASDFYAMIKIAIPLTIPGLVTTGAYSFLMTWNDFLFANTFTSTVKARTLTVEVLRLIGTWGNRWGDLTAGATITVIPVILVFLVANRKIVSGLTAGAVKG